MHCCLCSSATFYVYIPSDDDTPGQMKRAIAYGVSVMDASGRALGLALVPSQERYLVEASILGMFGINAAGLPQNRDVDQNCRAN